MILELIEMGEIEEEMRIDMTQEEIEIDIEQIQKLAEIRMNIEEDSNLRVMRRGMYQDIKGVGAEIPRILGIGNQMTGRVKTVRKSCVNRNKGKNLRMIEKIREYSS